MASRVNTKFVVILTASLLVVFGSVAALGYWVINTRGDHYANKGDKAMDRGDYAAAAKAYGRAVGHERTNVAWLRKWDEALANWAPTSEAEYMEAYRDHHLGIIRQISSVLQNDPAAQRDFLEATYRELSRAGGRTEAWEQMYALASRVVERADPDKPEWQKLRRYRGLAQLYRMRAVDPGRAERAQALEDLEAAFAADPDDMESALGIVEWYTQESARSRRSANLAEAEERWNEAMKRVDALVEQRPNDPRPMLRQWELRADHALQKANNLAERRAITERLAPDLDRVVEAARAADATMVDSNFLQRLGQTLTMARPADGAALWVTALDAALERKPGDATAMLLRGLALSQMDNEKAAIEQFQKVVDLPDPTVSLDGVILRESRVAAMRLMTERQLALWEKAPEGEKPAMMAEVERMRNALAARVGAQSAALLRVDGLIALARRQYTEAVKHFSDLKARYGGTDLETLYLLAFALTREGSTGAALTQYDAILNIDPGQTMALAGAAEIELRMEQLDSAKKRLTALLTIDPTNPEWQQRMQLVDAAINKTRENIVDDPVVQALVNSARELTGAPPNPERAAAILDEALTRFPDDLRLLQQRLTLHVQSGNSEAAKALVEQALARNPQNQTLKEMKVFLEEPDPIVASRKLIAQADMPTYEKNLMLYPILRGAGEAGEAAKLLAEAAREAPEDSRVIEYQFVEALEAKDMPRAQQFAARAASANLDQVNGLTYQARIELVQGRTETAIGTLERVTQQLPFSAPSWKLLGQAQLDGGRVEGALESFRLAYKYRPNDLTILRPYVATLLRLGRTMEALEVLRGAVKRNAADQNMAELWLDLEESTPGGDKNEALTVRERLLVTRPTDTNNRIGAARLQLALRQWDKAKETIAGLPTEGESAIIRLLLEARMLSMQDDVEGARRKVSEFAEAQSQPQEKLKAWLGMGELMLEFGRDEQAFAALREARKHQDPAKSEADRRLADALFERGRQEEAVEVYKRILAAPGATDEGNVVAKRMAEALVRLERWDEAEATVRQIEAKASRDLQTTLLLADVAAGKKDTRTARQLVDEAVKLAPNDPLPYFRRAQLNSADAEQFALVVRDLDQAIRLRPDLTAARMMKIRILFQRGRENEAIAEELAAVQAAPTDDELRMRYISDLQRYRRTDDAKVAATEATKARGAEQPMWFVWAGDVYANAGDFRGALDFYRSGYGRQKDAGTLGRLVDSLLRQSPPIIHEANAAIDAYPRELAQGTDRPVVLVLRARAAAAAKNEQEALRHLQEAWPLVKTKPSFVMMWFDQLDQITNRDPKRIESFVLSLEPSVEALGPTGITMLCSRLSSDPSRWDEVVAMLDDAQTKTNDAGTVLEALRLQGQIDYFAGRYAKAVERYRKGLAILPTHAEFNNNLAYALGRDLGKPDEALPYALQAVAIDPTNANVLDTLGWLYLAKGNLSEAETTLGRGLNHAKNDGERLPLRIHLADVKRRLGDLKAARDHLEEAKRLGEQNPILWENVKEEYETVNKALRAAE